ncbi:MAG: hypothetical protein NZ772_14130 [Cyanobacteria bacterium]|nr:hypothetical protein [Cyanobacteriota bacterium]MDW8202226.1 hypothetical protein [Cyanobacteriota bacterium SKYGB_h_bin112]
MSVGTPVEDVSNQNGNGTSLDTPVDNAADGQGKAGSLAVQSQTNRTGAIQAHVGLLPNGRPVFPQRFAYYESDTLPGHRPVALSTFKVAGLLPGDRPVAASDFHVVAMLPNDRPIVARQFDYIEDSGLPGHRPIAKSTLVYDENNMLPGGRPVASNQPDASSSLMGYLD